MAVACVLVDAAPTAVGWDRPGGTAADAGLSHRQPPAVACLLNTALSLLCFTMTKIYGRQGGPAAAADQAAAARYTPGRAAFTSDGAPGLMMSVRCALSYAQSRRRAPVGGLVAAGQQRAKCSGRRAKSSTRGRLHTEPARNGPNGGCGVYHSGPCRYANSASREVAVTASTLSAALFTLPRALHGPPVTHCSL